MEDNSMSEPAAHLRRRPLVAPTQSCSAVSIVCQPFDKTTVAVAPGREKCPGFERE